MQLRPEIETKPDSDSGLPCADLFALFGGAAYYPGGGWYDFKGKYPSAEEAKRNVNKRWNFWHVVNLKTLEVVDHYGGTCYCNGCPPDEYLY